MALFSTTNINPGETLNDLGLKYNDRSDDYFEDVDPTANPLTFIRVNAAGTKFEHVVGSTSPSAPDRSVQYNSGGNFTGTTNLRYLTAPERLFVRRIELDFPPIVNQNNITILGWTPGASNFWDVRAENYTTLTPAVDWILPSASIGYGGYDDGEFRLNVFGGRIELNGGLVYTNLGAEKTVLIATLPAGYRPASTDVNFAVWQSRPVDQYIDLVYIQSNGEMYARVNSLNGDANGERFFDFSGITFQPA